MKANIRFVGHHEGRYWYQATMASDSADNPHHPPGRRGWLGCWSNCVRFLLGLPLAAADWTLHAS
jgi:hypothetical protein